MVVMRYVTNFAGQPWSVRNPAKLFEPQIKLKVYRTISSATPRFRAAPLIAHVRAWPANERKGIARTA